MSWTASQIATGAIGVLHLLFMIGELYPWGRPKIMELVLRKWPRTIDLSANDRHLVAMIVHNAGVYDAVVAAGLFAAAWVGPGAYTVQVTLLAGGIVAGLLGAATLSRATIVQAVAGAVALAVVVVCRA
jgi:uncharacterized membrane protein